MSQDSQNQSENFTQSLKKLEEINLVLEKEIAAREDAEKNLQEAQIELEKKVAIRTSELSQTNILLVKEINERHEFERALKHARDKAEMLAAIVESSEDAIIGQDLDGMIMSWNQGAETIFGYKVSEVIGKPATMLSPQRRTNSDQLLFEKIRNGERLEGFESILLKKNGTPIPVFLTISAIRNSNGYLAGISTIARDISEQKQAQELLLEKETRLRLMVEQMPAILWTTDTNLVFTSCVGRGLADLNLSPNQVLGTTLYQFFYTDKDDPFLPIVAHHDAIKKGLKGVHEVNWSHRTFQFYVEPLKDLQDRIIGAIGLALDISERKNAEEQVRKSNQELIRLNQIKSEFTSTVSHELRTPLSAIQESINIILDELDGPITPAQRETLTIAKNSVLRLGRLINNVLDLTRLESGRMDMYFKDTDMHELVTEVHSLMSMAAQKAGLKLFFTKTADDFRAVCDPDRIKQVLINLIDNAIKFSPKNSTITVTMTQDETTITLSVEDQGIGIKEDDLDRIFENFEQTTYTPTGARGSGLGLSICKNIMREHNGHISVSSRFGEGSRFVVCWPKKHNAVLP